MEYVKFFIYIFFECAKWFNRQTDGGGGGGMKPLTYRRANEFN